jgi:hypothetical protein
MEIGYVNICRPHCSGNVHVFSAVHVSLLSNFLVMTLQVSTKEFQKYDIDPDRSGSSSVVGQTWAS